MTEISTIIEMYDDILPRFSLSLNLKSYMFNKLQKNSGGAWDNTKFKDYFQINYLEINYLNVIILSQNLDKIDKAGVIDYPVIIDSVGSLHLFIENSSGTSPPYRTVYSFLEYS